MLDHHDFNCFLFFLSWHDLGRQIHRLYIMNKVVLNLNQQIHNYTLSPRTEKQIKVKVMNSS